MIEKILIGWAQRGAVVNASIGRYVDIVFGEVSVDPTWLPRLASY
jgi:hypothetical protein